MMEANTAVPAMTQRTSSPLRLALVAGQVVALAALAAGVAVALPEVLAVVSENLRAAFEGPAAG